MNVTKLVKTELSSKWGKPTLGVINPEHTPVLKEDPNDDFSDMQVTGTTLKPSKKQFSKPELPKHLSQLETTKTKTKPTPLKASKKPSSTEKKRVRDIASELLKEIPKVAMKNTAFRRISLIAGKDLRTSVSDYNSKLLRNKEACKFVSSKKKEWKDSAASVISKAGKAFQENKLSEEEYQKLKEELEQIKTNYQEQLWKQKVLTDFLCLREGTQLDLQELNLMLEETKFSQEKQVLEIQNFVLKAKEKLVSNISKTLLIEELEELAQEFNWKAHNCINETVNNFLYRVKQSTHSNEVPLKLLEQQVVDTYSKWQRQESYLNMFVEDITGVFCTEFNLDKASLNSEKLTKKKELETRVVSEFINQYLDKLQSTLLKKSKRLEAIQYKIETGKEMPKKWEEFISEAKEKQTTKPKKTQNNRAPNKRPGSSNVGSSTKKFLKNWFKHDSEIDEVIDLVNQSSQKSKIEPIPASSSPRVLKSTSKRKVTPECPFSSIAVDVPKPQTNKSIEHLFVQLQDPPEPPSFNTRSELLKSGNAPFHPFMDKEGKIFDPQERFHHISNPKENYVDPKYIQTMAQKSPAPSQDWFVRPHHLKSVTQHPFSVQDDPQYYRNMELLGTQANQSTPNQEPDKRQEAISHLESTLAQLKSEVEARRRGQYAELKGGEGWVGRAIEGISSNLAEKDQLVFSTYEGILNELRRRETQLLNYKRAQVYEECRSPREKWYEMKTHDFTAEMHRNNASLRPNNQNKRLLNQLRVTELY